MDAPAFILTSSSFDHETAQAAARQAPLYGFDAERLLARLMEQPVNLTQLIADLLRSEAEQAPGFFGLMEAWVRSRQICFADQPSAQVLLVPTGDECEIPMDGLQSNGRYKLSRFTCLRAVDDTLILDCPLSHGRLQLISSEPVTLVARLATGVQVHDCSPEERGWLNLFVCARAAGLCDQDGNTAEDLDPHLRQWEFHDLLFHTRSRAGRHDNGFGATWRFDGEIDPPPALRENNWPGTAIALPGPLPMDQGLVHHGVTEVQGLRRSIRTPSPVFLSKQQLGEFLYRCAKISRNGEQISRPYPGGGGIYELELYALIDRCYGIPSGFYFYDGDQHSLHLVSSPNQDTEAILQRNMAAMAMAPRPQIAFTISSRFARVANKYQSIAYAVQLKNCGVLIATMYQIATAMGLAPCAVGAGDSDQFARLTGLKYTEEGSLGEFVLSR